MGNVVTSLVEGYVLSLNICLKNFPSTPFDQSPAFWSLDILGSIVMSTLDYLFGFKRLVIYGLNVYGRAAVKKTWLQKLNAGAVLLK